VTAPESFRTEGGAKRSGPLDAPWDIGFTCAEDSFCASHLRACGMTSRKIGSLVGCTRDEGGAAVRVGRPLARACSRSHTAGVSRVPFGGELSLVSPESSCEHAGVFLDLSVGGSVSHKGSHMVDRNTMPLIHLCLGRVPFVGKRVVLVEHLSDASDPIPARADGSAQLGSGHLGRIVHSPVPLGALPGGCADPADAIRTVIGVDATGERLGLESSPVGLVGGVLLHRCRSSADHHQNNQKCDLHLSL